MTGPTAYGLPVPPLVTFTEAEAIGGELHDRWAKFTRETPPLGREDFAWADMVQFVIRRADEAARERARAS